MRTGPLPAAAAAARFLTLVLQVRWRALWWRCCN